MGYVYLVQPAELSGTNRFKIGMSSHSNLNRLRSYKVGSRYILTFECDDALEVERNLKIVFNKSFKRIAGREYFEVDCEAKMIKLFVDVVMKHKNRFDPIEEPVIEPVITKSRGDWMKRYAYKS